MRLSLSAEDQAFRQEMAELFTSVVPAEVRRTVLEGGEITEQMFRTSQRALNDAGIAVPHWPQQWGGRGGRSCSATSGTRRCSAQASPPPCRST
ncbi:hypothetical protein [Nocardioides daphniae]|uniref:hypothetical protein n=1 Tax=Nocardioides daphniae TaxID=402297 RepID=UPI0026AF6A6F